MSQHDLLSQDLQFNSKIAFFLKETVKWSRFLSIVGFITVFLLFLMAVFLPAMIRHFNSIEYSELSGVTGRASIMVNFIILAVLILVPSLYLLKFSSRMKEALEQSNQMAMENAFESLKSFFKFYGILTIILLILYFLGTVGFIIGGSA